MMHVIGTIPVLVYRKTIGQDLRSVRKQVNSIEQAVAKNARQIYEQNAQRKYSFDGSRIHNSSIYQNNTNLHPKIHSKEI